MNASEVVNAMLSESSDDARSQILCATLNPGLDSNAAPFTANADVFSGSSNKHISYGRAGDSFAVAGDRLISKAVVDDAYEAFLNTSGELEDKLMAALLAAKRPKADKRCSRSSYVAFITVAKPNDPYNKGFLDLQYSNCRSNVEPVYKLYDLFVNWKAE